MDESLDDQALRPADPRGGRPGARATALAVVVLASSLALVPIAALLMLALPFRALGVVLGLVLLGVAWELRPRARGVPAGVEVPDGAAPALRSLVTSVAAELATPAPRALLLTAGFDCEVVGSVLVLGTPTWLAAAPQARVALVARSISLATRERRRGVVGAASQVLDSWSALLGIPAMDQDAMALRPGNDSARLASVATAVAQTLLWVVGFVPVLLGRLLRRAVAPAVVAGRFAADADAARVAGTSGALSYLDLLDQTDALDLALQRAALARRPDVLDAVRGWTTPADRRSTGVSGTPTLADRAMALRLAPDLPAVIALDDAASAALDVEIAPAMTTVGRRVRDRYL